MRFSERHLNTDRPWAGTLIDLNTLDRQIWGIQWSASVEKKKTLDSSKIKQQRGAFCGGSVRLWWGISLEAMAPLPSVQIPYLDSLWKSSRCFWLASSQLSVRKLENHTWISTFHPAQIHLTCEHKTVNDSTPPGVLAFRNLPETVDKRSCSPLRMNWMMHFYF